MPDFVKVLGLLGVGAAIFVVVTLYFFQENKREKQLGEPSAIIRCSPFGDLTGRLTCKQYDVK